MDIDVSKLSTSSKFKIDRLFITVYQANQLEKPGFKGFAKSLSSKDKAGPFDVLPMHENFVTQFEGRLEIIPEEGEKIVYQNFDGVIEVANNIVRIFMDKPSGKNNDKISKGDINENR